MGRKPVRRLRRLCLPLLCLAAASCGGAGTVRQELREQARDPLYLGLGTEVAATARRAVQRALETRPSDQPVQWQASSGPSGSVTPLRTFKIASGHYCRDYREVVLQDDVPAGEVRRACRTTDGVWRRVPLDQSN